MMAVDIDTDGELSLGMPRMLFERPFVGAGSVFRQHDVTPDGERFIVIEEKASAPPPSHLRLILNWSDELERLVPTQ